MESSFAESQDERQIRLDSEAALAASLNIAPWSPEFQAAINQMKSELLDYTDEEGNTQHRSEEEADDIVRQAFSLAKETATNARQAQAAIDKAGVAR